MIPLLVAQKYSQKRGDFNEEQPPVDSLVGEEGVVVGAAQVHVGQERGDVVGCGVERVRLVHHNVNLQPRQMLPQSASVSWQKVHIILLKQPSLHWGGTASELWQDPKTVLS